MGAAVVFVWNGYDKPPLHWIFALLPAPFFAVACILVENDLIIAGLVSYHYHHLRKKIHECMPANTHDILNMEGFLNKIRRRPHYKIFAGARILFVVGLPTFGAQMIFWKLAFASSHSKFFVRCGFGASASYLYCFVLIGYFLVFRKQMPNPPDLPCYLPRYTSNPANPMLIGPD